MATSFTPRTPLIEALDVVFGVIILADLCARLFISRHRLRDLAHPVTWADVASLVSFLAPLVGEAAGFLRILRTLRLLRSYQLLAVTALITTGFGDITLPGTTGRLIAVVIMIFGVTLFFRLASAVLRPAKVRFPCPKCGLQRHDPTRCTAKPAGTC